MRIDAPALTAIRDFLDRRMYSLVDHRLSLELALEPTFTGFPKFEALQRIVKRLDPAHEALFRLFRLGEPVDGATVRAAVPEPVVEALLDTELVTRGADDVWRTPGLLLVPTEGLLLIAGTPPSYPTAMGYPRAWFDLSTSFVARTLPGSLAGQRVVDVCSGTGVLALLCAARGATAVVGLELSESAVAIAGANAVLNGLDDRVRFRRSDVLSGLDEAELFDFVVCNLPYAPLITGFTRPSTVARVGNSVLWPLLEQLPVHLSASARGIVATWRSAGHGGSTYQLQAIAERLSAGGFAVSAFIDTPFDTIDDVLRLLYKDLSQRTGVSADQAESLVGETRTLLENPDLPVDGHYNQLVHFSREPGGTTVYSLALPGGVPEGGR
jgi:SAM-dependent methyltransferase